MKKILLIALLMAGSMVAQIKAKLIAENFDKPLYITNYPGYNNQLLVVQQDGIIKIIEDHKVQITPFLDISDRTHQPLYPADEMGMLGFTFHPQFNENKYFYVNYVDKDDFTVISRFTVHNKLGNVYSELILIKSPGVPMHLLTYF